MSRTVYALLVGIDDYPPPVRKLRGCVNDVNVMKAFLESRTTTEVSRIKMLTNQQATRAAVIAAFQTHFAAAKEDDVALFCYSGHGAQEKASEAFWHLEPDHLNETLVCYDSRQSGSWDLADKELAKLLGEVSDRKVHVVLLLDCCHSGSGTRMPGLTETEVRRCETDLRDRPLDSYIVSVSELAATSTMRNMDKQAAGWNIGRRHILLAACRDDEEAREYQGGGAVRGAFSYFLGETLTTVSQDTTYRDLFGRADSLVRTQVKGQSPQLEATDPADLGQPFLGGAVNPRSSFFIASVAQDGAWSIDAGQLHGIPSSSPGEGAVELALFDYAVPDDDLKDPARALYKARVSAVRPTASTIEVAGDTNPSRAPLKAVITSFPAPRLRVRFEGDAEGVALLRAALAEAAPGKTPSLYVREVADPMVTEYRVLARGGRYLIAKPDDERPLTAGIDGYTALAAANAVARIEHIERWKTTAELNNLATSIRDGDVEVEIRRGNERITEKEVRLPYTRSGTTWEQPSFRVRLKNYSQKTLYVALLDLPETFGIFPILNDVGCQKLDPGQETFANNGEDIPCYIPDDLWAEGVCELKDLIKVIISTREFDARRLAQDDLPIYKTTRALEQAQEAGQTRGGDEPTGTLDCLMQRVRSRHAGKPPQRIDDWRCLQHNFTIVRPLPAQPLKDGPTVLTDGVTIEKHPSLRAEVRLDSAALTHRSISAAPPFPRLLYDDPMVVQPFEFTAARSIGGALNVLELRGVNDPALVTEAAPLIVTIPRPLEVGEYVLPVGPDGEFYLPLGWGETQGNRTRLVLERLPQPTEEGTRTLGGALRIFFQKVSSRIFGTKYSYPLLAVAKPGHDDEVEYDPDPDSVQAKVAKAGRIALFVHGIIGDTRVMVGSLKRAGIVDRYDLVLTFDYENLNDPIPDTARALKARLEAAGIVPGTGKQLDVVAHSMGGLVSRWFIEREGGNRVVRKLVMLGTPNGGSPWPVVADWATTALAVGLNELSKITWPAAVVAGLVRASKRVQVTLDQMNPSSPFLRELYASGDPKVPYALIAGDTSLIPAPHDASQRSRLGRLLARLWSDRTKYQLANLFFDGPNNDVAVLVESMRHLAAGRDPVCYFRTATPCDHVSYFQNAKSLEELASILGGP